MNYGKKLGIMKDGLDFTWVNWAKEGKSRGKKLGELSKFQHLILPNDCYLLTASMVYLVCLGDVMFRGG